MVFLRDKHLLLFLLSPARRSVGEGIGRHRGDFLAHTHIPYQGGVDVPFEGYDLWSTFGSTSLGHNSLHFFNMPDIWQTVLDYYYKGGICPENVNLIKFTMIQRKIITGDYGGRLASCYNLVPRHTQISGELQPVCDQNRLRMFRDLYFMVLICKSSFNCLRGICDSSNWVKTIVEISHPKLIAMPSVPAA